MSLVWMRKHGYASVSWEQTKRTYEVCICKSRPSDIWKEYLAVFLLSSYKIHTTEIKIERMNF